MRKQSSCSLDIRDALSEFFLADYDFYLWIEDMDFSQFQLSLSEQYLTGYTKKTKLLLYAVYYFHNYKKVQLYSFLQNFK